MKNFLKKITPYRLYEFIWRFWHGHFSYYFYLFPVKKNKIVFVSYYGRGYGDSGKYIAEEILKRKDNKIEMVWLVSDESEQNIDEFPKEIRTVRYKTWKALYEMATSSVWIDNCRKNFYPPKKKNQTYIHTEHGGIPLKRVEKDVENNLDKFYVNMAKKDSEMIDLFLSNSDFKTEIIKNSYWYNGEIMQEGLPRMDILNNISKISKSKIKEKLSIKQDTKVCLYAPTFRRNHDLSVYDIDYERLINTLELNSSDEWVILLRLHPNIAHLGDNISNSRVQNVTSYSDMQELLMISDILISDYSSTVFEFIHTGKPVYLYASDVNSYKEDRGYYFNLYELPFPLCQNNDDLIKEIKNFSKSDYETSLSQFKKKVGLVETDKSSSKVVDYILTKIN